MWGRKAPRPALTRRAPKPGLSRPYTRTYACMGCHETRKRVVEYPDYPDSLPCPTCGEPNRLTRRDVASHYQCDSCADLQEYGGGYGS